MPIQPKQQPPYYTETNIIKKYVALLNQTGTNAPTPTILINTLDGIPEWTRSGTGDYFCLLTGQFTLNKTTIEISSTSQDYDAIMVGGSLDINSFSVYTYYNGDGTFGDGILQQTPIIITVYP